MSTITVHPTETQSIPVNTQSEEVVNTTGSHFDTRIPTHQQILYGFGDFGNGFMFDLC